MPGSYGLTGRFVLGSAGPAAKVGLPGGKDYSQFLT